MFVGGVARVVVMDNGQPVMGVIDRNNNTIIPFQYSQFMRGDSIEIVDGGYILINGQLFNNSGNMVVDFYGVPVQRVRFVGGYIISAPPGGMSGAKVFRADDYSFVLETMNQHEIEQLLGITTVQRHIIFEPEGMVVGAVDNEGNFIIEPGVYDDITVLPHLIFAEYSVPRGEYGGRSVFNNVYDINGNILFEGFVLFQLPHREDALIYLGGPGFGFFINAYGQAVTPPGFWIPSTISNTGHVSTVLMTRIGNDDTEKLDAFIAGDYTGDVRAALEATRGNLQWVILELIRLGD